MLNNLFLKYISVFAKLHEKRNGILEGVADWKLVTNVCFCRQTKENYPEVSYWKSSSLDILKSWHFFLSLQANSGKNLWSMNLSHKQAKPAFWQKKKLNIPWKKENTKRTKAIRKENESERNLVWLQRTESRLKEEKRETIFKERVYRSSAL